MESTVKYFILSALTTREMHGYELITSLAKITGRKPSPGQIYPVLKQMKALGYVTVKERHDGKRKLKYYKLTTSGRKAFEIMSHKFETIIRSVMQERIKICAHCNCELLSGAYTKKIKGRNLDFCCCSCAASYK
jgi:DNA-binding PadR family transcriptional regulator